MFEISSIFYYIRSIEDIQQTQDILPFFKRDLIYDRLFTILGNLKEDRRELVHTHKQAQPLAQYTS